MKRGYLILGLLVIVLLAIVRPVLAEGFATSVTMDPKCPTGYKFFNDKRGESFCCGGTVDPLKHKCSTEKNLTGVCAFKPGMRVKDRVLPLCSQLVEKTIKENGNTNCPRSLSHYASSGKCCKTAADMDGVNCIPLDLKDKRDYCVIDGSIKPGEQSCRSLKLNDESSCPTGIGGAQQLQKIWYKLGDREFSKYPTGQYKEWLQSFPIPACTSMDETCFPENVLTALQGAGYYKDKSVDTWKYSCKNYTKRVANRDTTGTTDSAYLQAESTSSGLAAAARSMLGI